MSISNIGQIIQYGSFTANGTTLINITCQELTENSLIFFNTKSPAPAGGAVVNYGRAYINSLNFPAAPAIPSITFTSIGTPANPNADLAEYNYLVINVQ